VSFARVAEQSRQAVAITVDGAAVPALAGDTVLTALRLASLPLRTCEFGDGPRAGFCLMGACQDCWLRVNGRRMRACQTYVADGMMVTTRE
jgi:predicted molibdopterin-dependent oxidoreductase YjgC